MKPYFGQAVRYIFTGGMTTVVNYMIFFLLLMEESNYLLANSLAWVGAVLFAYFANRKLVFQSDGAVGREFVAFVVLRLTTLLVECLCLWVCVDCVGLPPVPAKVIVSIVTVTLNYFACRYHVFQERGISHE